MNRIVDGGRIDEFKIGVEAGFGIHAENHVGFAFAGLADGVLITHADRQVVENVLAVVGKIFDKGFENAGIDVVFVLSERIIVEKAGNVQFFLSAAFYLFKFHLGKSGGSESREENGEGQQFFHFPGSDNDHPLFQQHQN